MTHETLLVLEMLACSALLISAAVFVKNALTLTRAINKCELKREHRANEAHLAQFRKRLNALEGRAAQTHIQAKIAQKFSQMAHDAATDSKTRVGALEKSTHRIHFKPVDALLDSNPTVDAMEKLLNPSREKFDWFDDGVEDADD